MAKKKAHTVSITQHILYILYWYIVPLPLPPEPLLLSVGGHPNWSIMAISVEGRLVFQEKAKPQKKKISGTQTGIEYVHKTAPEQPQPKSIKQRTLPFQS